MLLASRSSSSVKSLHSTEHGNVLFLILIAVALFAALSYAVTNSNRTSSVSMSYERAKSCVAEIDSLFSSIQTGITRIRAKGYEDYEIDVSTNMYKTKSGVVMNTANATCTSNDCRIYADRGGNVPAMILSPDCLDANDGYIPSGGAPGHVWFEALSIPEIGTPTENSLFARIIRINDAVCAAWNYREALSGIPTDTLSSFMFYGVPSSPQSFNGTLSSFPPDNGVDMTNIRINIDGTTIPINGKYTFCHTLNIGQATRGIMSAVMVR